MSLSGAYKIWVVYNLCYFLIVFTDQGPNKLKTKLSVKNTNILHTLFSEIMQASSVFYFIQIVHMWNSKSIYSDEKKDCE